MIPQKEHGNNRMLKDLILSHPFSIIALVLMSILGTLFSLATPLIMGQLIDNVLIGRNMDFLLPILLGISGIFLISALSDYFSNNIRGKLNLMLFREISFDLFGAVQEVSLKDLQKIKTGDLLMRTVGNTNVAVNTVTSTIPQIAVTVFGFFIPFMIMFSLKPNLAVISMSPVILFAMSSYYYGKKVKKYQRNSLDSSADMNSFLKEAYSIVPLTKVFLLEQWIQSKFALHMSRYFDASLDVVKVTSMSTSLGVIIYGIPTLLVLIFGSRDVLLGSMSIGTFTAFIGYISLFFSPVQMLSVLWTNYKGSLASLDRIREIFLIRKESWGENRLPLHVNMIEFKDVWFSYDTRVILQDFHATFTRGRNYIIGDNGSGKTTLIMLLCGLYRPDQGAIFIDGQDISSLSRESLRRSVSVVFSDSLVFDGTIYDNIRIGDISASHEEVINASRKAELHESVMHLPSGYETEVGESGFHLSSGEKQKIALARVILRNSPIIIFDEFTRSIDIESKKSIFSIIRTMKDTIIIIITHDRNDIESECNCIEIEKIPSIPVIDRSGIDRIQSDRSYARALIKKL